jgi:hypothetical protein
MIYARSLRAALPACLVAVVVYLCFLHKAFNIDDATFLAMAEHMLKDPLHPAAVHMSIDGLPPQWLSSGVWSGPVMPALLVPSVAAGGAEWLAHLSMLGVFLIGIVATAAFALRLQVSDAGARWAAILTATSPAVLAMAMTSMPDVPTMSFGVLGAERLLAYRDHRGVWRAIAAAVSLALCVLSRQHGVLVIGCLIPLMLSAWPRSLRAAVLDRVFLSTVATMFCAVALVGLTYAVMRDSHAGANLGSNALHTASLHRWRANLTNIPAQWVLTFPLGLAWTWLHGRRMVRSGWCWLGALAGAYLAVLTQASYQHMLWLIWQAPVTALGAAVLVDIVLDVTRRRDVVEIGLAAWLFIALPAVAYAHLPPKYLVPSAPAMAVLIARHLEQRASPGRRVLAAIACTCLALGVLIIRADATHAEIGRRGGKVVAEYVHRGERVWFDGGWGFQWYAARAGGMQLTSVESGVRPGDIVVAATQAWIVSPWPNKVLVERLRFDSPGGRIMQSPAGFFSNVEWGPLPWMWSRRPRPRIEVWRIR